MFWPEGLQLSYRIFLYMSMGMTGWKAESKSYPKIHDI